MATDRSELTSMSTELRELTERVAKAGEELHRDPTEDAALALFEAERGMRAAARALERAHRSLG